MDWAAGPRCFYYNSLSLLLLVVHLFPVVERSLMTQIKYRNEEGKFFFLGLSTFHLRLETKALPCPIGGSHM